MKQTLFMLGLFLLGASATAIAQNNKVISELSVKIDVPDGITIVTVPGQNTNGEDLKCAVYEAFSSDAGAGGISCNWTPGYMQKKTVIAS